MTQKIQIRRHPDGWHVTRPAFGFGQPSTTVYGSGADALGSLTAPGIGSTSAATERNVAGYSHGLAAGWGQRFRPRWIEAST